VPDEFVVRYTAIIAAFLIQAFLFCLVGQGIIAEVGFIYFKSSKI
jgi:hypothetical protein